MVKKADRRAALVLGDSISALGTEDSYQADLGYLQGAMTGASVASVNAGGGGQPFFNWVDSNASRTTSRALTFNAALPYVTHVFAAMGTNDLDQNNTDAQIKANMLLLQTRLDTWGVKVIPFTIPNRTNAANNAKFGTDSVNVWTYRTDFNDDVRNGECGAYIFIDPATSFQDGVNANLWVAAGTNDGIHPNGSSQSVAEAAVTTQLTALMA
jgi:hypothetical protein